MFDAIIIGLFVFLSGVLIYDSFKKWQNTKKGLYFLAIGLFVLAGLSAFVDWGSTFFCILGGLIVRVITANTGNKKANKVKVDENDGEN